MTDPSRIHHFGLSVDAELARFIEDEALQGTDLVIDDLWKGFAAIVDDLGPLNRKLLERRASLQTQIDDWHRAHTSVEPAEYRSFLEHIGYIEPVGPSFEIGTTGVDREIAVVAGPQLVVPVTNARYALNAANARWGSLYDALYGTDALGDRPPSGSYDARRGERVVAWVREFLDTAAPLDAGSHLDAVDYRMVDGGLQVTLRDGRIATLGQGAHLVGWTGAAESPRSIVLEHHNLGIQLILDADHPIGRADPARIADVRLEAAVTCIMDCEDSIAAVDGADKTHAYRNWLRLMRGTLVAEVTKSGTTFVRSLHDDLTLTAPNGDTIIRPGRSLLLVRNVGHLMTTPAVLDREGNPIPEGILDAFVTVLCAREDALRPGRRPCNTATGSIYVVKPKMHGPEEVRFAETLFSRVEDILGLPRNTVKIGIMDEERRTTLNLAECLRAARNRVAFINTGFLDRTGDEIHTSMHAGPMVRKAEMKGQRWIKAYEDHNVDTGLVCGLRGRAQIGKGMWAAPDLMGDMLRDKISHPRAGAGCAWVPSPTAATLHATHYHRVDVAGIQKKLHDSVAEGGPRAGIDDLLVIPLAEHPDWSATAIQDELDNNTQGILGYVVRWVDQGIGCSKVPDINDVGLMEDRATCRISSQHIANWLCHGVVSRDQVIATFRRMATVVDHQNATDPAYTPMAPGFDGPAYRAAVDLVLLGVDQPSGYTEPILHAHRLEHKQQERSA
ncbi:MAG: malate synthase G [Actinomycetota bacterium]